MAKDIGKCFKYFVPVQIEIFRYIILSNMKHFNFGHKYVFDVLQTCYHVKFEKKSVNFIGLGPRCELNLVLKKTQLVVNSVLAHYFVRILLLQCYDLN